MPLRFRQAIPAVALSLTAAVATTLSVEPSSSGPDVIVGQPSVGAADIANPAVPRPDHVVVVMMEDEHRSSVIGSSKAP